VVVKRVVLFLKLYCPSSLDSLGLLHFLRSPPPFFIIEVFFCVLSSLLLFFLLSHPIPRGLRLLVCPSYVLSAVILVDCSFPLSSSVSAYHPPTSNSIRAIPEILSFLLVSVFG